MKKQLMKIAGIILALAVNAPCCYFIGGLLLREAYYVKDVMSWREKTSPISPEVAKDMCQKLEISAKDWRCEEGATVYAPDFFKEINERFTPSETNPVTIDEFDRVFGEYLYETEPIVKQKDGLEYYRCWYDLNTDHIYHFVVFVKKGGEIFRLIATVVH